MYITNSRPCTPKPKQGDRWQARWFCGCPARKLHRYKALQCIGQLKLFYSFIMKIYREIERDRERDTDRQADRDRESPFNATP